MNLTEAQANALLEIGGAAETHGYIPQRVLNDLLSYDLIYLDQENEVEFTEAGQEVYDDLADHARKGISPSAQSET